MRRMVFLSCLIVVGLPMAAVAGGTDNDPSLERFHWGVEFDMMPGGPAGGSMMVSAAFENKNWAFTAGAGYDYAQDKRNGNQSLLQLEFKGAHRAEIADYTFMDLGWDYSPNAGSAPGMSPGRDFTTGPYVGLTRHFPHFLLTGFVMPVQYQYSRDGNNPVKGFSILENGGIGLVYLFK